MRFQLEHTFDAPVEAVVEAMFDPALPAYLAEHMTQLDGAEPLEREEDEHTIRRRVLYRPVPLIRSVGPKRVPAEWMAFTEATEFDKRTKVATFENIPYRGPATTRLTNRGTMKLTAAGSGRTRRVTQGELKVKVFLVGKLAEQLIHVQAKKLLDEEARVFARFLRSLNPETSF